ncbi:MAG: right-handed parallel beta-helix repeat-containing protein [Chitinispirillaceae bacterium]|nr:right-handed parallel beta-helix repeat-containing protein [Chitinispirillaceae bacterium]
MVTGLSIKKAGLFLSCLFLGYQGFGKSLEFKRNGTVKAGPVWNAPIGIPDPGFGINQSIADYHGKKYDYDGDGTPDGPYFDNGTDSMYTHYVNPSSGASTDKSNPYGTKTAPRKTFPDSTQVHPGAIIFIRGAVAISGADFRYCGSDSAPIYLRGKDTATSIVTSSRSIYYYGHYVITERLKITNGTGNPYVDIVMDPATDETTGHIHHLTFRDCKIAGIFTIGHYQPISNYCHHILVYRNEIYGDFDCNGVERRQSDETSGIGFEGNCRYVWVLENEIHHYPEDLTGGAHAANYTAHHLYLGRNTLHHSGSQAFDIKEASHVVFSQNVAYHFHGENYDTEGNGVVIHYGPDKSTRNVWIIFNMFSDITDAGIQVGGAVSSPTYLIGNIIYNVRNAAKEGYGIVSWQCDGMVNCVNNTIYDCDVGIASLGSSHFTIENNILACTRYNYLQIESGDFKASTVSNNIYFSHTAPAFACGDIRTYAQLVAAKGAAGSSTQWPGFADTAAKNFTILDESPAIGNGKLSTVYATFVDSIPEGGSISMDYLGRIRQADSWDIGAFQYSSFKAINRQGFHHTPLKDMFYVFTKDARLTIVNNAMTSFDMLLSLVDLKGRTLGEKKGLIHPGSNSIYFADMTNKERNFRAGSYVIKFKKEDDVFSKSLSLTN